MTEKRIIIIIIIIIIMMMMIKTIVKEINFSKRFAKNEGN